ncbi:hypothetical protein LUZ60_002673 [Juncus effusus]|nr:hypothetical protein LUZ60_002673 [Juncus effusus]
MEHFGTALVLLVLSLFALIVRFWWRRAQARAEEVKRRAYLVAAEAQWLEVQSLREYEESVLRESGRAEPQTAQKRVYEDDGVRAGPPPIVYGVGVCAVCGKETNTRCKRCKAVKYCSGKCQISDWRNGHKDMCRPLKLDEDQSSKPNSNLNLKTAQVAEIKTPEMTELPPPSESKESAIDETANISSVKKEINDDKSVLDPSINTTTKDKNPVLETSRRVSTSRSKLTEEKAETSGKNNSEIVSEPVMAVLAESKGASKAGGETSKEMTLTPYYLFLNIYGSHKLSLRPFGLANIGNSCYANVVFQCLTFTRPLMVYLSLHKCTQKEWCLACEFERLALKGKQGTAEISLKKILAKLIDKSTTFGLGKQEDAHEFMRFVIDKMQSTCLKDTGLIGTYHFTEETTPVQIIFGGYLRSKIRCEKCQWNSERTERMLDLTVEVQGNIGTLEEALVQFTSSEILDGDNKYHCIRCNSYERAKKKMTILEAPNVLTIALKRFQSGRYGKITKPVRYPEHLNLSPYTTGTEASPVYALYAVVVHKDVCNDAFSGHYIAYVKDTHNKWYKLNDSKVKRVSLEKVLSKCAYMLLYARCVPRAPNAVRRDRHELRQIYELRRNALSQNPGGAALDGSSSETSSLLSTSDEGSSSSSTTTDTTIDPSDYLDPPVEYEYFFGCADRVSHGLLYGPYKPKSGDPEPLYRFWA